MSLKVSQSSALGAAAASRAAALNHAGGAVATRGVDRLSTSNRSGPEEEALRFSETWDELQQQRPRRRARLSYHGDAIRFGSILASEEVGAVIMSYRSQHEGSFMPTLRLGAMLYEQAKTAIGNGGYGPTIGTQLNRFL
ncbi:MAG: hypothetical protein WCZ23_04290 [Rhodospirillaceae bacterium]